MYNVKPGQLVECEWIDPVVGSDWKDSENVSFHKFSCRSVGYVHLAGEEGLILTPSYGDDSNNNRSLLLQQHLPWGCIVNLWIYTEEK